MVGVVRVAVCAAVVVGGAGAVPGPLAGDAAAPVGAPAVFAVFAAVLPTDATGVATVDGAGATVFVAGAAGAVAVLVPAAGALAVLPAAGAVVVAVHGVELPAGAATLVTVLAAHVRGDGGLLAHALATTDVAPIAKTISKVATRILRRTLGIPVVLTPGRRGQSSICIRNANICAPFRLDLLRRRPSGP